MTLSTSAPLDDLLKINKIGRLDYLIYRLFNMDEQGREYYKLMVESTFDEQPPFDAFTPEILAYNEGRRSIFRHIKLTVNEINHILENQQ